MRSDLSCRLGLAAVLSLIAHSSLANSVALPNASTPHAETAAVTSFNPTLFVEPTTTLSLAEALRYAAAYPRAEQHLLLARQQLRQAAVLHSQQRRNPELSIDLTGLQRTGEQTNTQNFSVSQQLDLFGTRLAQQRLTQLQLDAEQLNQALYPQALAWAVKAAYQQVVLAEQALQLAQDQQQLSQRSLEVAKKRVQAGRIAEVEVTRLAIQQHTINNNLIQATATEQLTRQQLSLYWGNPSPQFSQTSGATDWPRWNRAELDAQLAQDPQQTLIKSTQQQADAQLDLAQRQRYGMPTLRFGVESSQTANNSSVQVLLGVSLPLPIFAKNQAGIMAAQAVQGLAHSQAQMMQRQRQLAAYRLWQQQQTIASQYQSVSTEQIPLAKQVQQNMLIGFEAGKFSLLEVLLAQQEMLQRQQYAHQLLQAGWQTTLRLQAIFAGLPIESNPTDPNVLENQYLNPAQDGDAAGWSGVAP